MSLPIPTELVGTTQALFYEFRHQTTSKINPPYTLKEYDWEAAKSMYKIYMAFDTEYDAAIALLGSWSHWKKLCEREWFLKYKREWDEEKRVRNEAMAERALLEQAEAGNVQAARYIHEGKRPPTRKSGRPANHKPEKPSVDKELEDMSKVLRRIK